MVSLAHQRGASDLHMESGLPAALRIDGKIEFLETPINGNQLREWLVRLLGAERWQYLLLKKSIDCSEFLASIRCRINAFFSYRGYSVAIRLLDDREISIDSVNLHPVLKRSLRLIMASSLSVDQPDRENRQP